MDTITLSIPNINCHHCIMTVQRETGFVDGADFVDGDIEGKTATFRVSDATALESLKATLAETGYPASG